MQGSQKIESDPISQESQEIVEICETPGDGNCFFYALCRALNSAGLSCTIQDLRHLVASRVLNENDESTTFAISTWIILYRDALKESDYRLLSEYKHVQDIANESTLNIQSRTQLYRSIMSPDYWGDEFAIRTLEDLLRLTILIWNKDMQSPMHTRTFSEIKERNLGGFRKIHWYILLLFSPSSRHYEGLSVNSQMIFTFATLPSQIKTSFHLIE